MKHPHAQLRVLLALTISILLPNLAKAATFVWNVASPGENSWNNNANWLPNTGNPGVADTAVFGLVGTSPDATTVNNIVSVNTTITALSYTNTAAGTWHVTQIPAGVTLTSSGTVTVGGHNNTALSTSVAMTGGGTYVATGAAMTLGNTAGSGTATPGTLDMSGLSNFVYNASGGTISLGTLGSRSAGNLILASVSNSITAGTINVAGASGTGSTQTFSAGAGTNNINAGTINIGRGRSTTTFQFASGTGGLRLRGTGGTDADRSTMTVGNRDTGGTGNLTTTGNASFNGHPVDLKFSTLTLGQMSRSGTEAGLTGVGNFLFDQGTVDATTINLAVCNGNSPTATANGTLTVGGGSLLAGNISLVNVSSTGIGSTGTGTLNINSAMATVSGNITKTTVAGTGTISMNSGLLVVAGSIGSVAVPVDNLNISDSTLVLAASSTTTNVAVINFTTGGVTNLIYISSVPAVTAYPAQFPLITYAGSIGGSGFDNNIGLAGLPASATPYAGYLSNNTATLTVDLVLTGGPAPAQPVKWSGAQDSAWDTSTLNWLAGASPTNYNNAGDFVTFDDSASTSSVNLVTPFLTPGSLTVSNNLLTYAFTGSGKLSGSTGLTKKGTGTLIVSNSVANDFTGGISVEGTLAYSQPVNVTVGNTITGSGALVKNGTNTLTLSGVNSFSGGLTVNNGILRATTTTAPSTGTVTVNNGGTFVAAAAQTNTYVLAGGTFGVVSGAMNTVPGEVTAAAATTSTILLADPQNLAATDATELAFTNTWHGSGTVIVATVTNDTAGPDSGNGFRLRGVAASDFSGTLALSNNVKGELQTTVAGPFSPAGTAKIVMSAGTYYGTNGTAAPTIGGYSEMNLRNNSGGDTIFGNDLEIIGSGIAVLNPLGSATTGTKTTVGNLKIGGGQELVSYLSAAPTHVITFTSVTLTGGNAKFSPKSTTFGSVASVGSDITLNNIGESAASGITMAGLRTLTLTGLNTYSGATVVSNGTLLVEGVNQGTGAVTVSGGTLGGLGTIAGPVSIAALGTLSPGNPTTPAGTLTINNALVLGGTNIMDVNKSGSTFTGDVITNVTAITYGGTLQLNLTGDPLVAGDAIKLYGVTSASGAFAEIIPATPGTGLTWNTSTLSSGVLSVMGAVDTTPTNITAVVNGNTLMLSWPADHTGWKLQAQTNSLSTGLNANWVDVPGSTNVNTMDFPIDRANPAVFFRMIYP